MSTKNNKDYYQTYDSPMYSLLGLNMALNENFNPLNRQNQARAAYREPQDK